jgi:pilus assembly protein Flp/PilA
MGNLIKPTSVFVDCEDGPTATEYAVMLALIIMVGLMAVSSLGTRVSTMFTEISSGFGG